MLEYSRNKDIKEELEPKDKDLPQKDTEEVKTQKNACNILDKSSIIFDIEDDEFTLNNNHNNISNCNINANTITITNSNSNSGNQSSANDKSPIIDADSSLPICSKKPLKSPKS